MERESLGRCGSGDVEVNRVNHRLKKEGNIGCMNAFSINETHMNLVALAQEGPLFRSLFESHPDATYGIDAAGNYFIGNQAVVRNTGYTYEEFLTMNIQQIIVPEDLPKVYGHLQRALAGQAQHFECHILNRHQQVLVMDTTYIPIHVGEQIVGVFGIARDISEQRRNEEQVRKSETSLRLAQKIAQMGSWEYDLDRQQVVWSEEMSRIMGWEQVDSVVVAFENAMNFVNPGDVERVQAAISHTAETGEPYNIQFAIKRPDGEHRHLVAKGETITDRDGRMSRIVGIVYDITDRIVEKKQLADSEQMLHMIVESMLDLVAVADANGHILYASPSHEKILGYMPQEYLFMNPFSYLHPDEVDRILSNFLHMLQTGQTTDFTFRSRHKDGHYVHLEGRSVPVAGADGQVEKVVVVARDISERRKTEALLLQSEKLAIAGQLAASIAHEIRNPLTALKGFTQLMIHNKRENDEHLRVMYAELERIEMILSELLVLAKPQLHNVTEHDLADLLHDVLTLMTPQANMHNVVLAPRFEAGLPSVLCDRNQLKQVFLNFLKNSFEAMPNGGTITVDLYREGDEAILRFIDEGCGIAPERLMKIGEPFYTTKDKGTGLGLMVSKSIIETHNGTLHVTSELNVGTTVALTLPLQIAKKDR